MRSSHSLALLAAGAIAAMATSGPAAAQDQRMTVLGHAVHQRVLTEGEGGNVLETFPATVEWLTFDVQGVHDRLFREASLSEGTVDVGFVANRYVSPNMANLFEPLDPYLEAEPIEDFEEIAPGMRETVTYDGKLYGIPFRHATSGLHYNKELLAEKGFDRPPQTLEELIEYARALTYTRADGTQVHGLILDGPRPTQIADIARAMGGDFLTTDYQIVADQPGMVDTVALLRDLYDEGVLPKSWPTFTTEDVITYMQQGRAAMAITPFGRYRNFNDAEASKFPGAFDVTTVPPGAAIAAEYPVTPAKTEFWVMTIPQNAPDKELAWAFIRQASTPKATVQEAINGNGPVRPSAYDDPRVRELVPYAAAEAAVLEVARPPLPGFENAAKAEDIFVEELELVLLGRKEPQAAMDSVVERTTPLLPGAQ